jgi:hypothetical protein
MTVPTRVAQPWDTRPYQRIASVRYTDGQLTASFEDGACVRVAARDVLRPGEAPDWERLTFAPHEITVPADREPIEISWLSIRLLTDPAFEAHWRTTAAQHDRLVGARITALRESRDVSVQNLARRSGLPSARLRAVEAGRARGDLDTLERILAPFGYSLDDLSVEPDPGFAPAPAGPAGPTSTTPT